MVAAVFVNLTGVLTGFVEPLGWFAFAGLQSALFILLYYAGAFGGADAKSLICLSVMYPVSLTDFMAELGGGKLTIPISAFNNALILTLIFPLFNFAWNVSMKLKGVDLFKGLERESTYRKFLALFLLRKISFSHYRSNSFKFTLAEKRSRNGLKKIVFFTRFFEEDFDTCFKDYDYVFASFLIPLQAFMLLGLAVRLLYGDIILQLALLIVKTMLRF